MSGLNTLSLFPKGDEDKETFLDDSDDSSERGKENRVNILKSIDEGPYQMGTVREPLAEGTEGAPHLGPERPRVYSDLSPEEKDRYNADIWAINILLQGLPKDIYTLINHYTDAKYIWTIGQGMNPRGGGAAGYGGVQNKVRNVNSDQARPVKCYNYNGSRHIARNYTQPKRPQNFEYNKDKMLLIQAQENRDLALNVDNVFQADDYDAFDSDVDEAPTTQTMFTANLSSVDPVTDEAGPSYDSDLLSEYVKDNEVPVVHSEVSSVLNDDFMMIYNDMCEPHAQSVSNPSRNTVVKNSLTAELATHKEEVELYERRAKFELTEREQNINEQLRLVISNHNHAPAIVHNTEDTLEIAKITRKKINDKIKDPECVTRKVKIAPHDNSKENFLATFKPHKQLTLEQIFWSQDLIKLKSKAVKEKTTVSRPIKALTVTLVEACCLALEAELTNLHEAKVVRPLDRSIVSACRYTKHSQKLLEYAIGTCPQDSLQQDKQLAHIPLIRKKQVTFAKTSDKSNSNTYKHVAKVHTQKTNVPVTPSTGVKRCTNASGSQSRNNTKKNRISSAKGVNKLPVEEQSRTNKSVLRTSNCVDSSSRIEPPSIHHNCNVVRKVKQVWKPKQVRQVWKPTGKVLTTIGHQWRPTGQIFTLGNQCPLTKFTTPTVVSAKQNKKRANTCANQQEPNRNWGSNFPNSSPLSGFKCRFIGTVRFENDHFGAIMGYGDCVIGDSVISRVVQIILWYLDSGCSKHMTGDRSWLMNFIKKFTGTVRFENDHFGAIMGYGDCVIGDSVISRVYYVKGLGHNLFSVRQFFYFDLEVAFRKHSCYVRDTDGVELIKGSRGFNLYTISVEDMMKSSPICLLSKASKNKSWLWHRCLNHLNFGTINNLARKDLVRGLPRLKFKKDHLCSACQLGKSKKHTHKPKTKNTNLEVLNTLHMDLCGPKRVQIINGKKYILVIVDDYSWFIWVKFLRSKDETPEVVIKFVEQIQVGLNKTVRYIRTDNDTEFVNQTLTDYYERIGIFHQNTVPRTSQHNDIVERRN
nr:retrovirus-related Pol polyprotein from transposon TNT 1-94 [Tanacetum cinerariifolium]